MTDEHQQIGPYRVVRKLGEGGMGAVYLAEHERLHRHVALKVLPPTVAGDRERRARFQREAHARGIVHRDIKPAVGTFVSPPPTACRTTRCSRRIRV